MNNLIDIKLSNASLNVTGASPIVSDKYKFVSTIEYIKPFLNRGWKIRKEKGGKNQFGQHILHLQHSDFKTNKGDFLEVLIINSHDRSRAFTVAGGLFRLVCENGLMVGEDFESFKFKHIGQRIDEKLDNSYDKIVAKLLELKDKFNRLENTLVTREILLNSIDTIAQGVFNLETKLRKVEVLSVVNTNQLDRVHREGDKGLDMFTAMNVIQENITRKYGLKVQLKETCKETGNLSYTVKHMQPTEHKSVSKDFKVQSIVTSTFLKLVA